MKTTARPHGGAGARGQEALWVRVVRDWDGVEAYWYCGGACAEDPVYGLVGALRARRAPGEAPLFCSRCGRPLGNPLSARGLRRARELAGELGGWQADALAEHYGLSRRGRRARRRQDAGEERRWAA